MTQRMRERGFLPCTEVAELVGVHKATIYRWVRDNKIKAKDFSGAYYIEWASVVEYLGEMAEVLELKAAAVAPVAALETETGDG